MPAIQTSPSRLLTGMCAAGWHEGTKPKDWKGVPVQVCVRWQNCPCECHSKITKMYEDADMAREIITNPDYVKPERTWYMPVYGIDYGLSTTLVVPVTDTPDDTEDGTPAQPATRIRTFDPTPSGRAAKGELEAYVLEVTNEWLIDHDELCTPKFVSDEIARVQHIDPPSVGAIGAVFDRWVTYGYANISRKPVQFLGLTDQGKAKGLDLLKAERKRKGK